MLATLLKSGSTVYWFAFGTTSTRFGTYVPNSVSMFVVISASICACSGGMTQAKHSQTKDIFLNMLHPLGQLDPARIIFSPQNNKCLQKAVHEANYRRKRFTDFSKRSSPIEVRSRAIGK